MVYFSVKMEDWEDALLWADIALGYSEAYAGRDSEEYQEALLVARDTYQQSAKERAR